ncbi:hypothetical protein [Streptomyces paludis]|uniref:Uncharacterized protein n=1 Tax=Streptomyces paludis TaxID=2282738 RepID=A0A345HXQ4_9ACTN|nr:hypothetical protein [Streptomyces paludis]AXG81478.1 hypothetical protein DVK44_31460 [Streptomyces paludis]
MTGWTERAAPLGPGGAHARHRAVRRLLAPTRTTARPWPGGGWQFADRAGRYRHCPDLVALWTAVRSAAGPVVVPDPADRTRRWSLPDPPAPDPHALVVWTAAVLYAGPAPAWLTVRAVGLRLTVAQGEPGEMAPGAPVVTVAGCADGGIGVEAPAGARALAERLADLMAPPDLR